MNPSMLYAGTGAFFFGIAWTIAGMYMMLNKNGGMFMKLTGAGCFFWGLALVYLGRDLSVAAPPLECSPIVMYSLVGCPFCEKAKEALDAHGKQYQVIEYSRDMTDPPPMPDGTVPTRFPQIWVNHENMGGFVDIESWVHRCQ